MPSVADALGPPPDQAPKPPKRGQPGHFTHRVQQVLGESPDQWAERVVSTHGMIDEAENGILFGYGPDLDTHIVSALYGREYGEAVDRAQRRIIQQYRKDNPKLALLAGAAGNIASTVAGGELLSGAGKFLEGATGAGKYLRPAAEGISKLARRATLPAAGAGAALGAHHGGVGTGSWEEGAAEGALAGSQLPRHILEAVTGAGLGALQGSGEAGPGHRLEGAETGGITGGVFGTVAPIAGRVLGGAAHTLDANMGYAPSRWLHSAEDRLRAWIPGAKPVKRLPGPQRAAINVSRELNKGDEEPLTHERVSAVQAERERLGLPPAKAYQVTGRETRKGIRSIARKHGTTADMTEGEYDEVGERQPYDIRAQGKRIAPHTENTRDEQVKDLETAQSRDAALQFREDYAKRIQLDARAMEILDNDEMRKAMGMAERAAGVRNFENPEAAQQVKDIRALNQYFDQLDKFKADHDAWVEKGGVETVKLTKEQQDFIDKIESPEKRARQLEQWGGKPIPEPTPPEPPEVTAGAIDRIRRNAQAAAESLKNVPGMEKKITHDVGTGLEGSRVHPLDEYLDSLPHLQAARANYRAYERRLTALREGTAALDKLPADFNNWMNKLATGPDGKVDEALLGQIKQDMRVVARDRLETRGADTTKAGAQLRALDRNVNLKDNLRSVMGDEANTLFEAAGASRKDFRMARDISDQGSSTVANLTGDDMTAQHIGHTLKSPASMATSFLNDMFRAGKTMTRDEAEALIHFQFGDPHELVNAMEKHPEGMLAQALRLGAARTAAGAAVSGTGLDGAEAKVDPITPMMGDATQSAAPQGAQPQPSASPDADIIFTKPLDSAPVAGPGGPKPAPTPVPKASPTDFPDDNSLHVTVTDESKPIFAKPLP